MAARGHVCAAERGLGGFSPPMRAELRGAQWASQSLSGKMVLSACLPTHITATEKLKPKDWRVNSSSTSRSSWKDWPGLQVQLRCGAVCLGCSWALHARPREAPGLSAGGLQVARRPVTLKPSTTWIKLQHKKPPPADGGLEYFIGAGCYSAAILSACAVRSVM